MGTGSLALLFPFGCSGNRSKTGDQDVPIYYQTIVEVAKKIHSKEISTVALTELIVTD